MTCHYCGDPAEMVTGEVIYPHRPDLSDLVFWRCVPCNARVGTHPGTTEPLGSLAKEDLRHLRQEAHTVLDLLWRRDRGGVLFRGFVYVWLKKRLGMMKAPHIGSMDENECFRVIALRGEIKANMKETKKIWGMG